MPQAPVTLTPEQVQAVLTAFHKQYEPVRDIALLVRIAFPNCSDEEADGRSRLGRAVKTVLIDHGLTPITKTNYTHVPKAELTENHKEFIRTNKDLMTPVEMARVLFSDDLINNTSVETRAVAEFLRTLVGDTQAQQAAANVPEATYSPPKSVEGTLKRIDKYVFNHGINKEALTAQQRAGIEQLLAYMNTFRFCNQINLYQNQNDRDLFESSFVRYCYDKPDLTQEEVDQYISVSHDNVQLAATQTRMERLSAMIDDVSGSADERARISMSLVEAVGKLSTEFNQVAKRQKDLLGDLKEKRSDRIAQLRSANASILNLIQLWKEEKTRKKLLHLGDARKKLLEKTVGELSGMEEIKCRIMGLDPNQVIHG